MEFSAFVMMLSYIYHVHQVFFCIVGMCLFLPPLLIPWICIPVGFLGLVMDLYFEEALEAISRYVYAVPFWLLLTSGMLMILHWPFLIDDKVFTP